MTATLRPLSFPCPYLFLSYIQSSTVCSGNLTWMYLFPTFNMYRFIKVPRPEDFFAGIFFSIACGIFHEFIIGTITSLQLEVDEQPYRCRAHWNVALRADYRIKSKKGVFF